MPWFTYRIQPIDVLWENLKSVTQTVDALVNESPMPEKNYLIYVQRFLNAWEAAQESAKAVGWEGDFRLSPVVFWLPGDGGFDYGFAFKQDNNGDTFVVSPVPMPWLEAIKI